MSEPNAILLGQIGPFQKSFCLLWQVKTFEKRLKEDNNFYSLNQYQSSNKPMNQYHDVGAE